MATQSKFRGIFEGILFSVRILYLTNITRLAFWNWRKITIIKWVYFGIFKDALYFDFILFFLILQTAYKELIHFNASFLLA